MRAPQASFLTPLAMPALLVRGRDPYQWAGCAARYLRLIYCTNVGSSCQGKVLCPYGILSSCVTAGQALCVDLLSVL